MRLEEDYYIGLDCGTSSVGWAVTDRNYNLLRFNGKDMWGSHLFDEAQTADARRMQRNARKRLHRRRERLLLLQEIFAEEIAKIDPTFFLRLNESWLHEEDRSDSNKQPFSLFNDPDFTDKDYYREYPTIFHLRKAIIEGTARKDPRLVYLALHSILKNRGHFLFPGKEFKDVMNISDALCALKDAYYAVFEEELEFSVGMDEIQELLQSKSVKTKDKELKLKEMIFTGDTTASKNEAIKALVGYKAKLSRLFGEELPEDAEPDSLDFRKTSFEEEDLPKLEDSLTEDQFRIVESLKQIYDWTILANIMNGESILSVAKVHQYESNKEDLKRLKKLVRKYCPGEFQKFFYESSDAKLGLFSNYIGSINTSPKKSYNKEKVLSQRVKRTSTEFFYKAVEKLLKSMPADDSDVQEIRNRIEAGTFMPLLRSFRNGAVPYQINKAEMTMILNKASEYMPWLKEEDSDGISAISKIESIIEFRIPYYVGPLTDPEYNKNAWIVRKESGKIYPWNFTEKVDEEASDENFIRRMTNKCTYIPSEDVLPKNSLLYQKYMVLNEINAIRINGCPISTAQKQTIYQELFEKESINVTETVLKTFAYNQGWIPKNTAIKISGVDFPVKSRLTSLHKFRQYNLKPRDIEWIINSLTIHSDGGKIMERKLREKFKDILSEKEIKNISRMKFSGWGRLSRKFLAETFTEEDENGEIHSIIDLLMDTNQTLMQIINEKKYGLTDKVGDNTPINKLSYDVVEDLRVSPKVKRQIWQALRIVKEIEGIMKHPPMKIFVEVARYEGQKGVRTKTRKESLLEAFSKDKDLQNIYADVFTSLSSCEASMITKRDRLYLYYTQLGRCMYSGEPIDLDVLLSGHGEVYDIDHIYPFSKSNDDSLTNKVLVKSVLNREKTNEYPIKSDIRRNQAGFWKMLKDKGLINEEKYHRLTRSSELSESDLEGFINRQIVETSQSTKAIAGILRRYFGDETKVVYSKAGNVSAFRDKFEIYKARSVNHLHHAKDAYLNIVVGNTLATKFTADWFHHNVNFNNPYESYVKNAWDPNSTITTVKKTCFKNSVLFTRQPEQRTGQLFDLNPVPKGSKNGLLPTKSSIPRLQEYIANAENKTLAIKEWTDKYGGYNTKCNSHSALVKCTKGKKTVYYLIPIPIILVKTLSSAEKLKAYAENELCLSNVEVVREKLLFNTTIIYEGMRFTITGNNGRQLVLESSVPLILSNEEILYVKKLEKFAMRKKDDKNLLVDPNYDGITIEENEKLYAAFVEKGNCSIYRNRPANQQKCISSGASLFETLSIEDQVEVLLQLLVYYGMGNGETDLENINGSKRAGCLVISSTLEPQKRNILIVDTSITGLFENVTELK